MNLDLLALIVSSVAASLAITMLTFFNRRLVRGEQRDNEQARRVLKELSRLQATSRETVSYSTQIAVNQLLNLDNTRAVGSATAAELMREVSHALNTPLAQIELTLEEIYPDVKSADRALLRDAEQSIAIARAVVHSYRVLTEYVNIDEEDPGELSNLVRSVFKAARAQSNRAAVALTVSIPERVEGYGNYFVISLLLPLLQNAAEAAPDGSVVRVSFGRGTTRILLEVRNDCSDPGGSRDAAAMLRSNKSGAGHMGIGLKSVSTLLSRTRGAEFATKVVGDEFIARIELPAQGEL
ncbi:sensor histidine kinase [Kribbella sp. CA-293567]|uniref:sensor histidine kinase n=1 Tax=Kribbella sp. CA-293567 TaxID=3002436 RepID=UPI0022DD322E|nr:HAMP domain-containing sensor histidine kinase [Kribbella sp. CA-293567]WBQ05308.1 HAMP domain-containing sensor histidine kinase [Kribbella sp. CA-293567]